MPVFPFLPLRDRPRDWGRSPRCHRTKYLVGAYLTLLVILLVGGTARASSLSGLVGYWPFHEGTGTLAKDYSGNENTGNLINGPTWPSDRFGFALSLNGIDQYVEIPHAENLNTTKELTFSAWVSNRAVADVRLTDPEFHVISSKGWAPDAGGSWSLAWDKKSN